MPPIIDDTLFSQFVEAIKSQEIIFFSQFPMEKVSVLDRKSDYMIDDLKIIKPEGTHRMQVCVHVRMFSVSVSIGSVHR